MLVSDLFKHSHLTILATWRKVSTIQWSLVPCHQCALDPWWPFSCIYWWTGHRPANLGAGADRGGRRRWEYSWICECFSTTWGPSRDSSTLISLLVDINFKMKKLWFHWRGDTHKNDVLTYCQSKAKACAENVQLTDRDSAELIWRLLEVLIKQNGVSTFNTCDIYM